MSIEAASLFARVEAETDQAEKNLDSVSGAFDRAGGAAQSSSGNFSLLSGAGTALGTALGQLAATGLAAAVSGLMALGSALSSNVLDFLKGSISEAAGAQDAMAQLSAVLKSTGGAAGLTADELSAMATRLQGMTRFSDESIMGAQSLLLTFTKIGKDVFPEANQMVLDMSQALGQDLKSSAIQLGKALNDPIEGVTALRRVGVSLTEDQEALIKKLMATGDIAGAQKVIMEELATEFGGSSQAAAQTFGGQMEILKNKFGDVQESIGGAFLPLLEKLAGALGPIADEASKKFSELAPVFTMIFESFGPHIEKFVDALGKAFGIDFSKLDVGEVVNGILLAFDQFRDRAIEVLDWLSASLPGAVETVRSVFDGLVQTFQPITDAIGNLMGAFAESGPQFQQTGANMAAALQQVFAGMGPEVIANVSGALNGLAEIWRKHGDTILQLVQIAWGGIVATIGGVLTLGTAIVESFVRIIGGIMDAGSAALQGNWKGAWDAIVLAFAETGLNLLGAFNTFMNTVLGLVGTNLDQFRATWQSNWDMAQLIVSTWMMNITSGIQTWIIQTVQRFVTFVGDIKAKFTEQFENFKTIGQSLIDNVLIGIQMKVAQVISVVRGMVQDAIRAAGDALGATNPFGGGQEGSSGGGVTYGGTQDSGGRGEPGKYYLIGRGAQPELFAPGTSGTFMPNVDRMVGQSVTNNNIENHYNVTANYQDKEDEGSIRDTIAFLQMVANA